MLKIKKNDKVKVLHGKDSGKTGKVLRYEPSKEFLYVEGVNVLKVHTRQKKPEPVRRDNQQGRSVTCFKCSGSCPNCSKPARVGFEVKGFRGKSQSMQEMWRTALMKPRLKEKYDKEYIPGIIEGIKVQEHNAGA